MNYKTLFLSLLHGPSSIDSHSLYFPGNFVRMKGYTKGASSNIWSISYLHNNDNDYVVKNL